MATTKKTAPVEETTEKTTAPVEETTEKTTAPVEETTKKDNRVEVYIPKGAANDDPNLFVGVNGVNYILPRGKKSMVPPHVKAEIDRSFAAQNTMDERVDELLQKANQPLPGASV
jgi:hypothetical protein